MRCVMALERVPSTPTSAVPLRLLPTPLHISTKVHFGPADEGLAAVAIHLLHGPLTVLPTTHHGSTPLRQEVAGEHFDPRPRVHLLLQLEQRLGLILREPERLQVEQHVDSEWQVVETVVAHVEHPQPTQLPYLQRQLLELVLPE